MRQLLNHLEYHHLLTRKHDLFDNLHNHLSYIGQNVYDYVPLTFQITILEGKKANYDIAMARFESIFEAFEKEKYNIQWFMKN